MIILIRFWQNCLVSDIFPVSSLSDLMSSGWRLGWACLQWMIFCASSPGPESRICTSGILLSRHDIDEEPDLLYLHPFPGAALCTPLCRCPAWATLTNWMSRCSTSLSRLSSCCLSSRRLGLFSRDCWGDWAGGKGTGTASWSHWASQSVWRAYWNLGGTGPFVVVAVRWDWWWAVICWVRWHLQGGVLDSMRLFLPKLVIHDRNNYIAGTIEWVHIKIENTANKQFYSTTSLQYSQ